MSATPTILAPPTDLAVTMFGAVALAYPKTLGSTAGGLLSKPRFGPS